MILGLKTKDEAKSESKIISDMKNTPALQKMPSIIDLIASLQRNVPLGQTFLDCNILATTAIVNYLQGNDWKYVLTTVPATAPPNMPYVATWVRITKVDWTT